MRLTGNNSRLLKLILLGIIAWSGEPCIAAMRKSRPYLPAAGPAPIRFRTAHALLSLASLPPLSIGNELATNTVDVETPASSTGQTNSSVASIANEAPALPPDWFPPSILPADNVPTPEPAIRLDRLPITPEKLIPYFTRQAEATNAPALMSPIPFQPPSSSATYRRQ